MKILKLKKCGTIPVYNTVSKLSSGQVIEECNECCGKDKCNSDLCNHKDGKFISLYRYKTLHNYNR